jgi:hypothetical protein
VKEEIWVRSTGDGASSLLVFVGTGFMLEKRALNVNNGYWTMHEGYTGWGTFVSWLGIRELRRQRRSSFVKGVKQQEQDTKPKFLEEASRGRKTRRYEENIE